MQSTAQSSSDVPVIELERRGSALWLWLNRPHVLNAFIAPMLDAMDDALAVALEDQAIRCIVIAARGRAFCAGTDLNWVQGTLAKSTRPGLSTTKQGLIRRFAQTFNALEAFPKPVIAAVQGVAVAGGLELVLCCDYVIAARSARFGDGHTNYGLVPGAGGSIRLPRRVGQAKAKRMMFTGDILTPDELLQTDLVEVVVDDDALVETVDAHVAQIAKRSPLIARVDKQLVNDGLQVPLDVALRMERKECELVEQSFDESEGVAAFLAKRAPQFRGN